MAENNANCLVGRIITTASECKVACAALGRDYRHMVVVRNDRPAGCYGYTTNQQSYYNTVTSGESTSPDDDTAGICTTGILNLVLFLNGPVLKIKLFSDITSPVYKQFIII